MGKVVAIVGLIVLGASACGGGTKPPMQPDSDNLAAGSDGGAEIAPAQPPAPSPAPTRR